MSSSEKRTIFFKDGIPDDFRWLNPPKEYSAASGLVITVEPDTDFWQRTHYGFRRDNGHCLLTELVGDFTMTLHCGFDYSEQYHQAGIILYIDTDNWIKASVEYENDRFSRLGSVVTNLGYSDWATTDIPSGRQEMWYRLDKRGPDCGIESSPDGTDWTQMRIAHLHTELSSVRAGLYACSPGKKSFTARLDYLETALLSG